MGSGSRNQEGEDALGLPGTVTATARPGECAELPKGCSAHGGTRRDPEQLGGARAEEEAPRRGLHGPGARIHQRRLRSTGRRDTAQDPASPGTGRGREGPGQQGRSCPELSRSAAPPRSLQALQTESSGVPAGAESRAADLAPPLGLFLLGPHGVNNPH